MVVVDASAALAWCFPDETSDEADAILVALEGKEIVVPAVWGLEVANALLTGERRKRLGAADIQRFVSLLEGLPIAQDVLTILEEVNQVLPLARTYGLSTYDAAYLELAIRHEAPLASLDTNLRKAAQKAGVPIFAGGTT